MHLHSADTTHKRSKLTTRIHLANKAALLFAAFGIVLLVNYLEKQQALKHAEQKSLILLQHNLALHSYINKRLKPSLFKQTAPNCTPDFFDPTWMSSTYAVRTIDELYQQLSGSRYYYKEAAINARSPHNEADEFERAFIKRLSTEPDLEKSSGIRTINGKPYFFTMIRGESMEQGCLRCHSVPDKAPGGLVTHYGPQRSFNRTVGELVSVISIRIPLHEAYQAANRVSVILSISLIALLVGMYYLQKHLLRNLVTAPLELFQARAQAIANDPHQLGSQLPPEATQEMNAIASAFNTMSTRLKGFVDTLEQTVTERTGELAESERKLRLLFENMVSGFAVHQMLFDQHGAPHDYRFMEVNPAFEQLTGLKAADIIGKTVREVIPGIDPFWIETYGAVATSGQPTTFKYFDNVLERHFHVWAFAPQPGYFAALFNDITESILLEQQLRQAQKLQAIGRLAAGIAHDFNNKLMVVRGNAELAQLALPDTTKLPQRLVNIIETADQAHLITGQLLAFSRLQMVSPSQVDLNQVITASCESLSILIGETIRLTFTPGEDLWPLLIDPIQVDQILMNLALNARDAMPDGGHLTITTSNSTLDETACGTVPHARPGQFVLLSISDTGLGMDAETLQHIFEPFFTTKEIGKGTGLGLATIHGIVDQNNGFIQVVSQPGSGTTFRVYLPRHTPA